MIKQRIFFSPHKYQYDRKCYVNFMKQSNKKEVALIVGMHDMKKCNACINFFHDMKHFNQYL